MSFIHQYLIDDWNQNRESCAERFRLIVIAKFDLSSRQPYDEIKYAVAIEKDGAAEHAERYVQWVEPHLLESHVAAAFSLDGTVMARASNPPGMDEGLFDPLLELLVSKQNAMLQRNEALVAIADDCINQPFSAHYYTWGWYGNSCRVPADIVIVPEHEAPPHAYEAYLHQFGCHSSKPTTLEETASQLEDYLDIKLPRPLPFAPTYEDLAYRAGCRAEAVEERLRESLYDYDFERGEVMIADVRTGWDVYTYAAGVGFRWEWYPDS
jgi:hypothetical protein